MLRPTESPTLFLQQLGRGLRKSKGKPSCTVLDFVGRHRQEFRFDRRYRALLGGTRRDVERSGTAAVPVPARRLPHGTRCRLRRRSCCAACARRSPRAGRRRSTNSGRCAANDPRSVSAEFLDESGLDLDDVYDRQQGLVGPAGGRRLPRAPSWRPRSRLRDGPSAGSSTSTTTNASAPSARLLGAERRRTHRSTRRTRTVDCCTCSSLPSPTRCSGQAPRSRTRSICCGHIRRFDTNCIELFDVLDGRIDHVHHRSRPTPDCPLQVHARYTRIEILAAFGIGSGGKVAAWQSGVYEAKDGERRAARLHARQEHRRLLTDDAISRLRDQPHADPLGEPVDHPRRQCHRPALPQPRARRTAASSSSPACSADDRAFWFLGPARYRSHVGERPMAITWELEHPLSGDLYQSFAAAVA